VKRSRLERGRPGALPGTLTNILTSSSVHYKMCLVLGLKPSGEDEKSFPTFLDVNQVVERLESWFTAPVLAGDFNSAHNTAGSRRQSHGVTL
jgi:hypothetical protein